MSRLLFISRKSCARYPMTRHARQLSSKVPLVLDINQYARLPGPSVVPVDVSWHMPGSKRDPLAEFENKRLPRARFLDLDEVADLGHPLKLQHMMPSARVFARACSKDTFGRSLIWFRNVVDVYPRGTRYHSRVSYCPVSLCNDGNCPRRCSAVLYCVTIDMILLACSHHLALCSCSRFTCYSRSLCPSLTRREIHILLMELGIWT